MLRISIILTGAIIDVNFAKLQNLTGFRARYNVRDGVEELKNAFDAGQITDYTDLRYNNQRYLKAVGTLGHKDETDALVMAAFSNHRGNYPAVARSKLLLRNDSPGSGG